jgi:hypothetical protein
MKKFIGIIGICLFFISSVSFASHYYESHFGFANIGSGDCKLIKAVKVCGELQSGSAFPVSLPADGTMMKFSTVGKDCGVQGTKIVLKYECGEDKVLDIELNAGLKNDNRNGYVKYILLDGNKDVYIHVVKSRSPANKSGPRSNRRGAQLLLNVSH